MKRRNFLATLAGIPWLGWLKPTRKEWRFFRLGSPCLDPLIVSENGGWTEITDSNPVRFRVTGVDSRGNLTLKRVPTFDIRKPGLVTK